jgi:hypothetical protein
MLARVEGGTVVEFRDISRADVPSHKQSLWSDVVEEGEGPVVQHIIEGQVVRIRRSKVTMDLATAKHVFGKKVDDDAGVARSRYISGGVGMDLTYAEKFQQAQAVNDMGEAAAKAIADPKLMFPTLAASIGIYGATLWDCAQVVLAKYAEFARISYEIERTRELGKKAIREASDVAGVEAAYSAIAWGV